MRNLKLYNSISKSINLESRQVFDFCVAENKLFICFSDGGVLKTDLNNGEIVLDSSHVDQKPVKMAYLGSWAVHELCIAYSTSMVSFDCDGFNQLYKVPIDGGCIAAEWNPDHNLIAILTETGSVKLFTYVDYGYFDCLKETNLSDHEFANQFINVGWGSKETQFHGSEGKVARKPITVDDLGSTEVIAVKYSISWRGDGKYFAVSFLRCGHNAFLVFDEEGVPKYSSELCAGLEPTISWRPSGNLIAGAQRLPNKYQVVFFEKNGLRHGEFVLPKKVQLKKLTWSSDSEVLLVSYEDGDVTHVELWTTSNYHWYLKQSLVFGTPNVQFMWDDDLDFLRRSGKYLHVLTENTYQTYEWIWTVNHSNGKDENDSACVGVIDGCNFLVTAFRHVSVPPPMASLSLKHDRSINFVIFGSVAHPNDVTVILDNYDLIVYTCTNDNPLSYEQSKKYSIGNQFDKNMPLSLTHWLWIDLETYLCYNNNEKILLKIILLDNDEIKVSRCILNMPVIGIEYWGTDKQAIIQLESGELLIYDVNNEIVEPTSHRPVVYNKLNTLAIDNNVVTFGMNTLNQFFIDGIEIANNVSSYFVHSDFLLLTTLQHVLLCIGLHNNVIESLKKKKAFSDNFARKIERGAKLITVVQCDKKTILQMPRGNLETIFPRAMSIRIVSAAIDSKKYREAFDIMKVERINLNLLYDHNPEKFIENIDELIGIIENPLDLNMFLLELSDEDVTETMYVNCYGRNGMRCESKRQIVTDLIIEAMCKRVDADKYLLSIVTAYIVRRTQADLESALKKVKEAKMKETDGNKLIVSADRALGHILLLVNIDDLYNIALGLYDFDLIMMVAVKSQKDPKEYIPFLNDLNKMDTNYKRFTIDKYLKRYVVALESLGRCEDKFDECLEFVKTHALYKEALSIFARGSENHATICRAFGTYLSEKHCYDEAAVMFERGHDLDGALREYKKSFNWSECIVIAMKLKFEKRRLQMLFRALVGDLTAQRKYKEAGVVLYEHLNDYEEAIAVFCDGRFWDEAIRLVYIHNRTDIIESHVKPGVMKHADAVKNQILTNSKQFVQQHNRLKVVRSQLKLRQQSEFSEENHNPDNELYSDTASIITQSTAASKSSVSSFRSFRSSKNRRKHERKILSLKEGSAFEDIALIRSLHQLVTNTAALRIELSGLFGMLLRFDQDTLARDLQKSLDTLLKDMKGVESDIWNQDLLQIKSNNFGPYSTSNDAAEAIQNNNLNELKYSKLEPCFRYPPDIPKIHWKLFMLD